MTRKELIRRFHEAGWKAPEIADLLDLTPNNVRQVVWKLRHPEKNLARSRKWVANNREKYLTYQRDYYAVRAARAARVS